MAELPLPPAQEAEAQALFQRLKAAFAREAWQVAGLMASKADRQLLGGTEGAVREQGPRLGAQGLDSGLPERKQKGTRGRVRPVPPVPRPPAASPSGARRA